MSAFNKAWAVLKEWKQGDRWTPEMRERHTQYDDVPSVARGTETGQPEGEMHAPGTCPVCDKKRAMQEPDKRCLECGGIIPEEGGGPYDASNLCDCEFPFDTSEEWDIDREPTRNTWHPDFNQDPNEEGQ